jgi:hypothetical protein
MIEIIKNILPSEINKKIILLLIKSPYWSIGKDFNDDEKLLIDLLNNQGKDYGHTILSFDENLKIMIDTPLNLYAEIIYLTIKAQTKYKFIKPIRFHWNQYNSCSYSSKHKDNEDSFHASFVYNLHTNNGGTEINGVFYPSNEGEAIIFSSNNIHNGVTSTNTKNRFNLNCVIELQK